MEQVFLSVLNMSLTASFIIAAIMLARLPLKKAPKVISYALWAVAGFRLVFPFTLESVFSLLPFKAAPIPQDIAMQAVPRIDSGIAVIDNAISASLPAATPYASVNPLQVGLFIYSAIWLLGVTVMLIYSFVSIILLKRRLRGAALFEGNLYEAESLKTPFVIGLFSPKIYIPAGLTDEERRYIVLHELTHIRRGDHIVKMLAYFILCLHWFNPLAWMAFILMGADMEMSCDERVMKELGGDIKNAYSISLVRMAAGRKILNGSPLAFGEGGMKERIKNVLNFKKTSRVIIVAAVAFVAVLSVGFAVNRTQGDTPSVVKEAESIIKQDMDEYMGDDPSKAYYGSYTLDGIECMGDYVFAVVNTHPNEGEGSIRLYVIKENDGALGIIDTLFAQQPLSLGVAVYKATLPGATVVYGAVNEQLWLNLDDAPNKFDFTEIKVLYADREEKSIKISNHHAFMICLEGDIFVDDVQFMSGAEIVGRYSELPIGENTINNLNLTSSQGDPFEVARESTLPLDTEPQSVGTTYSPDGRYYNEEFSKLENSPISLAEAEKMKGQSHSYVRQNLGEPDGVLSGFWGDIYNLEDGRQAIIYYGSDSSVENIVIKEVEKWDKRPMILIDDSFYMTTDKEVSVVVDSITVLGTIISSVDGSEIPIKNGQSNFGCKGSEYSYYENGIIVNIRGKWIFFEKLIDVEESFDISFDDLRQLATKGDELIWEDFSDYNGQDVLSGLYSMFFNIEDGYTLLVASDEPSGKPMYTRFNIPSVEESIDIRYDDIDEFIGKYPFPSAVESEVKPKLTLATYVSTGGNASLFLKENNEFALFGPAEISFVLSGTYAIKDETLTLSDAGGALTIFSIKGEALVFESGVWLENWIEPGTELTFSDAN